MKCPVCIGLTMIFMNGVVSAAIIDTVSSPSFLFATGAQLYIPLYWRSSAQDWQWQHGPIADPVDSAQLSVEAFDVDAAAEIDEVLAWDTDTATWMSLGMLEGSDNNWSYTQFDIDGALFDEIADGLLLRIDIDKAELGYKVTLGKSVLTVNAISPPDQDPAVPAPTALLLCGLGTALIGWQKWHSTA